VAAEGEKAVAFWTADGTHGGERVGLGVALVSQGGLDQFGPVGSLWSDDSPVVDRLLGRDSQAVGSG